MKPNQRDQLGILRLGLVAGLGMIFWAGCSRRDDHAGGNEHHSDAEPRIAQITAFSERYEVFVEHGLVVAGRPTKFVTHVTDLKSLEPRSEGPLKYRMQIGQQPPSEQTVNAPTRPGIYETTLTFPQAGEWRVTVIVPTEGAEAMIPLPGLRVFASVHDAAHAAESAAPEGITLLKEQQWKIRIGTEPVSKRRLVEPLRLPAVVTARPGTLSAVTPPVAGRLLPPPGHSLPLIGDKVEAGQVLALIQPSFSEAGARLVEAEGELVRARLALEQAELAFKRVETLARADAKSVRELQEAEFALKSAQARYEAALALQAVYRAGSAGAGNQNLGAMPPLIELRSPIAGTIVQQSGAALGEYVTAEKALFTVLDASRVFLVAQVPETSVQRLGTNENGPLRGTR